MRLFFIKPDSPMRQDLSAIGFLLTGQYLQRVPGGSIVAQYRDRQWHVEGRRFLRLQCEKNVLCAFEVDGEIEEQHGPYERVDVVGGVVWAGGMALAELADEHWISLTTGRVAERVRLEGESHLPE
jgi:hypothetical protein